MPSGDDQTTDPLDTPLPCMVAFPGVRFGKGVALRALVDAATRWKARADEAAASALASPGCVCPPGANKECEAPVCPRQNPLKGMRLP